ncbi:MAG: argininosuccinate lyase, partial [Odoribacter sp.]|nr:argininosuccinate lyase [Odoribacter sp.]
MKLWDKGDDPDPAIIEFTSGKDRETDLCLAEWDIIGSMAHAIMLHETGLISEEEKNNLLHTLHSLFLKAVKGVLIIEKGVEDIHSQVEKELTAILGPAGKKIHTGRSRNDQVLLDIRLYTRSEIDRVAGKIFRLFKKLQSLSEQYKEVLLPGYTHMQPAMVSSFGLWFGAFSESLADDLFLLSGARSLNNRNPLGTAAGFGTTLPINRGLTTELLGFEDIIFNSAYASLNRGKVEMAVSSSLASVAATLARFSMDIILYMSSEFRFVDFPDEYVTGSSIMPQKKNPDVFEIIRARSNRIQVLPQEIAMITSNLTSGYHRDLQLLKSLVFNAFIETGDCIDILIYMLDGIKVRKDITEDSAYNSIFSTEEVNRLVKEGIPFRDAYKTVSGMINEGSFPHTAIKDYGHEG